MVNQSNQNVIKDIAFKYTQAVKNKFNISDAYLFGSAVNGTFDDFESDIDIAVISNEFTGDTIEDTFELMKLRRSIDIRIEPHPFLKKDFVENNPFAQEIMDTGISLL